MGALRLSWFFLGGGTEREAVARGKRLMTGWRWDEMLWHSRLLLLRVGFLCDRSASYERLDVRSKNTLAIKRCMLLTTRQIGNPSELGSNRSS